jgi:hypothetical protein
MRAAGQSGKYESGKGDTMIVVTAFAVQIIGALLVIVSGFCGDDLGFIKGMLLVIAGAQTVQSELTK